MFQHLLACAVRTRPMWQYVAGTYIQNSSGQSLDHVAAVRGWHCEDLKDLESLHYMAHPCTCVQTRSLTVTSWLMQDHAFVFLFAGHDTTATTLMALLQLLKTRPVTLQRLRDEQQQVRC